MAEYDDAEDIMGGSKESSAASQRVKKANGPIGKAWAWFSVQPAQTKVIVIGVIVVLGVVVWMMFKKQPVKSNADDEAPETAFDKINKDKPPLGGPVPAEFPPQPIPLGGGFQPGPVPPSNSPGQNGPTGIATQPAAAPAVARWRVTPGGISNPYANYNVNNAGHRQSIAITGSLN